MPKTTLEMRMINMYTNWDVYSCHLKATGISQTNLQAIVNKNTDGRFLGIDLKLAISTLV